MRYMILETPSGSCAIWDCRRKKVVSKHNDKEDAQNEMARIIEDNQWRAFAITLWMIMIACFWIGFKLDRIAKALEKANDRY